MSLFHRSRAGLALTAAFSLALSAPLQAIAAVPAKPRQPNVVVILADDLGYADVSAYMKGRFKTPHIDALAKEGVRFTSAYAAAPVCAPSRVGLLTGRYPQRSGFEFNQGPAQREVKEGWGLDTNELNIGQLLKASGYRTGIVGKWHMGVADKYYPTNRGFDEFVGYLTAEIIQINPNVPGVRTWPGDEAAAKGRMVEGQWRRWALTEMMEGPQRTPINNEDVYLNDYLADRSVEFIQRNAKSAKPYFLFASMVQVHSPHQAVAKYYDRFPEIKDEQQRIYASMIASLDDSVGQIVKAVEDSGEADNTIVVFASDNGCEDYYPGLCSCTPLRGGKLTHYEGGTRVPLVVKWPGKLRGGGTYAKTTSLMDILPTVVAAAGGALPTDRVYDGVDLTPYLTGRKGGAPHDVLVWRRAPLVSIRAGDWKLWETAKAPSAPASKADGGAPSPYGSYTLLFNLRTDPNETMNLADENPRKVEQLRGLIAEWEKDKLPAAWPSARDVTWGVCGVEFTVPI